MMSKSCTVAKEMFLFLESAFGFDLESEGDEDWDGAIICRGDRTAVKLLYEHSSAFVLVLIYKLIDGEMVGNPRPVLPDATISCFDFNDMLDESIKMKPAYEYGSDSAFFDDENGLSNYVKEFAGRPERYGQFVLKGDFSVLPQVEKIIKARALEAS